MVFPVEYSAAKYPCSRQFTWGEVSYISIYNHDVDDRRVFSADNIVDDVFGAMALRPIMDPGNSCLFKFFLFPSDV